ncbi:hypothetical protein GE21DRAFT_1078982 [Neurospora crassa]|nr:hypothetical protein GE21DRAFT_1078982 [Neurospora crassa]
MWNTASQQTGVFGMYVYRSHKSFSPLLRCTFTIRLYTLSPTSRWCSGGGNRNEGTQEMSGHWRLLLLVMVVAPCCLCTLLCDLVPSLVFTPVPSFSHSIESFIGEALLEKIQECSVHGPPRLSHPVTAPTNPHACSSSS